MTSSWTWTNSTSLFLLFSILVKHWFRWSFCPHRSSWLSFRHLWLVFVLVKILPLRYNTCLSPRFSFLCSSSWLCCSTGFMSWSPIACDCPASILLASYHLHFFQQSYGFCEICTTYGKSGDTFSHTDQEFPPTTLKLYLVEEYSPLSLFAEISMYRLVFATCAISGTSGTNLTITITPFEEV